MAFPAYSGGFLARWLRQPQGTWLRRATFQIHLWAGMILGLYIVVVCVSGSAVVFRNDVYNLVDAGEKAGSIDPKSAWLHPTYVALHWMGELHGRLLLGTNGMLANAVGGFLTAGVCLTGLVIWWPGITRWRRGLTVRGSVGWKRLNFDLHSAVGFWTFALLLMWGATGGYFVFPDPFRAVINFFTPINPPATAQQPIRITRAPQAAARAASSAPLAASASPASSVATPAASAAPPAQQSPFPRRRRPLTLGGKILRGFSFAHYGNFAGWPVKALWVLLGLAPVVLYGTALVMWWNRVLAPALGRWRVSTAAASEAVPELELERD
ncbi:MAG TPA: PepSY-associated TM helix domain-containing protein [Bryobacteraceae bacterium]|nr:PepSY-associated TM helix domain-containing protein [Bryobacteraceae bacterium]